MAPSLLSSVLDAQTRNASFRGEELRRAGAVVAARAIERDLVVSAVDRVSERLVAAASIANGDVLIRDESARLDGQRVLLVAGHCAGPMGVATQASLARALGATWVEAMYVAGDPGGWPIPGVDVVTTFKRQDVSRGADERASDAGTYSSFSSEGAA